MPRRRNDDRLFAHPRGGSSAHGLRSNEPGRRLGVAERRQWDRRHRRVAQVGTLLPQLCEIVGLEAWNVMCNVRSLLMDQIWLRGTFRNVALVVSGAAAGRRDDSAGPAADIAGVAAGTRGRSRRAHARGRARAHSECVDAAVAKSRTRG